MDPVIWKQWEPLHRSINNNWTYMKNTQMIFNESFYEFLYERIYEFLSSSIHC